MTLLTRILIVPGPGALKHAMSLFLEHHDPEGTQYAQIRGDSFTFHGMGGHTLRRDRRTRNAIVRECAIQQKEAIFESNNVTHYTRANVRTGESCFDLITKHYHQLD